jgi:hypothetical protein
MPFRLTLLMLLLFQLLALPAHAGKFNLFESDSDPVEEEKKSWDELQVPLPAYPGLPDAIAFEVPPARPAKFFVDPKSIAVGADGVVRYSLIAQSSSGVLNVSYEGMRCETREKKVYAVGIKDGAWSPNKFAKWTAIPDSPRDPQHNFLYDDFFCPQADIVDNANEAISALRNGINPRAQH